MKRARVYQPTSADAFESVQEALGERRAVALSVIKSCEDGATLDEIVVITGFLIQSTCGLVRDLASSGLIIDSGQRRYTRAGHKAIVWKPAPAGTSPEAPKIDEAVELRRLLQKAARQVDRMMQSWHDDEWDTLEKLGIELGDWER